MVHSLDQFRHPFFIGIAGVGMSAIAQYLQGTGKMVSGSDRFFSEGKDTDTMDKLTSMGIRCFKQNGEGIDEQTDLVVVSTAIEDTVVEMQLAKQKGIPIIRRAELLALIASSKKTIAVGGTSGKSTTSAMLFDILQAAGIAPSIISGAGLVSLIREGKIGNAHVGTGELLVIEADESDGSIVQYHPETGLLINIDKDHKEIEALMDIFRVFKFNSRKFIVNAGHELAAQLSQDWQNDFSANPHSKAGFIADNFRQQGLRIFFEIRDQPFELNLPGRHNMENALAAATVAFQYGVSLRTSASALSQYQGIFRRHQVLGNKGGVWLMDDYAHNPVKCAAAIESCQPLAPKVIAWFQPHGYGPTKFLRNDFVNEISSVLRTSDEIWMSEIFYAGGTTIKDISANDLIEDLRARGCNAFFVEDRDQFLETARPHFTNDAVLLLMGARDPSLEQFAKKVWQEL